MSSITPAFVILRTYYVHEATSEPKVVKEHLTNDHIDTSNIEHWSKSPIGHDSTNSSELLMICDGLT
eukprot:1752516-Amphidinium_carterae.1